MVDSKVARTVGLMAGHLADKMVSSSAATRVAVKADQTDDWWAA